MKKQSRVITYTKVVIFIAPVVVCVWLGVQYFSVFGTLSLYYDFHDESSFVSEWYPKGRANDRERNLRTGETYQEIVGDPVYVDLTVPRSYDTVDVTVEYSNPNQSLVEFGIVTSTEPWNIRLQPFESTLIDQAIAEWSAVQDQGVTLLQRSSQYESVSDFVADIPTESRIGVYNYDLSVTYADPEYTASDQRVVIDRALRGSHEFVVYCASEDLSVEFDVVDINREFNQDIVNLSVERNGAVLFDAQLDDDGIDEASGEVSETRVIQAQLPDCQAGAYTVSLDTSDDILITQVRSEQERIVLHKHAYLANNVEYQQLLPELATSATDLLIQGLVFSAKTDHVTGLQDIQHGVETIAVDTVHTTEYWQVDDQDELKLQQMSIPANDLYLTTDGYIAFTKQQYFDPNYYVEYITEYSELEDLEYIMYADYSSPEQDQRSTKTQTVTIDLDGVAGDRKDLTVVLSSPGIDRNYYTMQIFSVDMLFSRAPLHQRLLNRFTQ